MWLCENSGIKLNAKLLLNCEEICFINHRYGAFPMQAIGEQTLSQRQSLRCTQRSLKWSGLVCNLWAYFDKRNNVKIELDCCWSNYRFVSCFRNFVWWIHCTFATAWVKPLTRKSTLDEHQPYLHASLIIAAAAIIIPEPPIRFTVARCRLIDPIKLISRSRVI